MLQTILDSLAIDPRVLVLNAAAFLVLLGLMDRLFWKPMLRHLDRRNRRIVDAYQTIEETRVEMHELREEYRKRLSDIEAEARSRIQQTLRAAQQARETAIALAREEAEALNREGFAQIEADRVAARSAGAARLERAASEALARAQGSQADEGQRQLVGAFIRGGERT
jgi:F-type H+-transporting ATPase subunit b